MLLKFKNIINNPVLIFLVLTIFLGVFIQIKYGFANPDYLTDRASALEYLNSRVKVPYQEIEDLFGNKGYFFQNSIMLLFLFNLAMLIVSFFFKIFNWQQFLEKELFSKRSFVYKFINLAYPIWAVFHVESYMYDLDKHVYPKFADSMGIPYFGAVFTFVFASMIYYPIANFFIAVTYNTKIANWFYVVLNSMGIVGILGYFLVMLLDGTRFTWLLLPQFMISVLAIVVIINSIKVLLQKMSDSKL